MKPPYPEYRDGLTFDDVLLVPRYSEVLPPDVDLSTQLTAQISLRIPIISAAMDKVTESQTAIAMARAGGAGVIHRSFSIEKQILEVEKVKKSESGMILDPVTLGTNETVYHALALMKKYGISGLPVTEQGCLKGIVTNRDLRFEENLKRPITEVMTSFAKLITAAETVSMEDAVKLMHKHRIEKLPVIDKNQKLKALITIKDIMKSIKYPKANRDSKGRLRVGAAVGTGKEALQRIEALVAAGVDFIAVDTAHGASKNVVEVVKWSKKNFKDLVLIAGNVATAEGAQILCEAGSDAIKVGMGSGSICTTRIVAGVGLPQFTAIQNCAPVTQKYKKHLIADGGIKYSGDVVKALAAGADVVMVGSLLAGTDESPGETVYYQGRTYKVYRGMGSIEAMREGNRDRYGQAGVDDRELIPEGIEGMVPYRGELSQVLFQLVGGVRAGLGYLGCRTLPELRERAEFVRISAQGLRESHVHDVFVTKEAPNYRPND
ncbi:MAG: IMP dehydrogenase [Proteobacteria bacterium]|nr:IMP dehydrogenase [Pseudomonadota bacterium]NDC24493.1 IMP dehydrogenase [Pseudomonadota bacterium]NDD04458.1 IMP dehydrogenase [Pseudomonadota bacterium]NDG27148.1 IMP dehydrogenase [Pseudomonadota bacterium]